MSEPTSRLLSLTEPAFAPLRRQDLPSFLVVVSDNRVVAATRACHALGLKEDESAPPGVASIARHVADHSGQGQRLERVRLPSAFIPRTFSCALVATPLGPAVLFADPSAVSEQAAPQTAAPEDLTPGGPAQPVRFTWEVDGDGRFLSLSPSCVETLGARLNRWRGRSFADLADDGVIKDASHLGHLLQAGSTFSDVVLWTEEDPARRIEIGGVPLFDGTRRRIGVRGFGLIWPAPPRPPARERPPENVVPLRGGSLSPGERSAFHEIARSLNEAIDGWGKPLRNGPSEPASPSILQDGPTRPLAAALEASAPASALSSAAFEADLLDRLPIGLAVQQRGEIIHVNETLLDWCGFTDRESFLAAGGLSALLLRKGDQLELRAVDGTAHGVDVRLVATPWHGASAILHTLRLLDSPPPSLHATDDTDRERARGRADVLDALPCSAILIDRRGAIQALNEAAANLCGFRPKELAGEPFTLLFDPASQTEAVRLLDAAVAGESSVRTLDGVLRARHRLGGGHEMRATIGAAQTARDLFCLMLQEPLPSPASGLDLPVQEGPFAASTNAGDDPAPSPALDPFARRVSHAVRVPLTPILGFVEMVRGAAFGPIGNGRYAKHAEAAAAAAAQLMASLQDIEALTAVPPAEAPARVSLASAIQSALDHVAPSAKRRRVLLRRDGADDAEAVFNADVLAQGLRVVLEEAVRATPQGGQVVISLTLPDEAGPDRSIAIRIRDGGPALSEQEIALALSAFRMARVSDRFSSSGRPFHMARLAALLEANGGTLNLRRGVEIGMLCEIRLPC